MFNMKLEFFTKNPDFPFFIQLGEHFDNLFMHNHENFLELVIVLNGTATHVVNSEQYIIKKGDIFIIHPNIAHGYEHTHDLKICNIMYQPDILYQIGNDLRQSPGYQALFVIKPTVYSDHPFKSMLQLSIPSFEMVMSIITSMLNEYNRGQQGYQTLIYSKFLELVVFLSRQYAIYTETHSEKLFLIAKTVSYIEMHYLEEIKLNDLAEMSCLSARQFIRIFKENYQLTPINYILQLRLQHSCSLLKKSTKSISEIAYESGFSDSNYFSRQFKNFFGMTPKEYRGS